MLTEARHEQFTAQATRGKLAVARGILEGKQKAPARVGTANRVANLVAAAVPEAEDDNIAIVLALAKIEARKASEPKTSAVRRRLFLANVNAKTGPGGMHNGFAQTLGSIKRWMHALQKRLTAWAKDKKCTVCAEAVGSCNPNSDP